MSRRIKRTMLAAAGVVLATGMAFTGATPANAGGGSTVFNRMLCEPDTGWCFQTNPPYVAGIDHQCFWDYKLNGNNLRSGMYYTGCERWGADIH